MIKQAVATLLEKEMDRKDFLKLVGFGLLAILGVNQLMKGLSQQAGVQQGPVKNAQYYGSLTYGRKK